MVWRCAFDFGSGVILDNAQPSRTPKSDVVTQILKDLDEAVTDLPLSYEEGKDKGRMTKGAALAIKARVLLYNERWAEAAQAAKSCIDLDVYSLFPDYRGIFLEANEADVSASEAIVEVHYTALSNPSFFNMPLMGWWPSYLPTYQLISAYYMKNGLPITDPGSGYDPENPFMDRDPRFEASIFYPGCPFKMAMWGRDRRMDENWLLGGSGFKPRKWINQNLADINNTEGTNKIFLRYAEVILTYAEAKNEASGPDASVYDAIDQLRNRVGMTTLTEAMPGLTKEEMREVIRNERRIELVFEGLRFPDIQRWKIGEEVMVDAYRLRPYITKRFKLSRRLIREQQKTGSNATRVIDQRSFNPKKDYLWPIPLKEMNSNKNMIQNPGY